MANYRRSLQRAIRRGVCTFLQNYANLQEVVKFLWEPLPVPQNTPFNAAKHLIPWICNDPPPEVPDPEFLGGQCDGVRYAVVIDRVLYNNVNSCTTFPEPTRSTSFVWGPIQSIRPTLPGNFNSGPCPGFRNIVARARASATAPITDITLIATSSAQIKSISIVSVTRTDGLPDDCGDGPLPEVIYNEGDNIINIEFEYTPRGLPPIILGGVLALGYANINLNAEVVIPFTFEFNANFEGKLIGELNLNRNEVNIDTRVSPPGGDREPDTTRPPGGVQIPGTPIEPPPSDEDDLEEEEDEETPEKIRVIRGVVVTVTSINGRNPFTEIFQDENPNVWAPDLGLVQFLVRTGKLNSAWTGDIRVKNIRQFIPVPDWEYGAIKVSGTPRQGVQWTLTPVYVQRDKTNEFALLP